jgi:hypothetical protein
MSDEHIKAGGETPARYRMKPVVIEAMRYETTIRCIDAIQGWAGMEPRGDGTWRPRIDQPQQFGPLVVHTLEGDMTAQPGDWIIRGVQGEFYPCKPDIFALTYEPAPAVARPVAADGGASAGAEIPEDIALALSDLQRESRAVGEYGYGPDRGRFEREEAKARAECDAEIRSALSAARAQAAEATAERDRLRATLDLIRDRCRVVYWPGGIAYPIEHNPHALGATQQSQQSWDALRAALSPASPPPGAER